MPDTQAEWIGLIAGNGRFPLLFAENARRLGYRVSAVALTGEADPSLEKVVDRIHWIALGQLRRLIKAFKQDGVRQAVMVGGVKKTHQAATGSTLRPAGDRAGDHPSDGRLRRGSAGH